jgi:hypothetical protein
LREPDILSTIRRGAETLAKLGSYHRTSFAPARSNDNTVPRVLEKRPPVAPSLAVKASQFSSLADSKSHANESRRSSWQHSCPVGCYLRQALSLPQMNEPAGLAEFCSARRQHFFGCGRAFISPTWCRYRRACTHFRNRTRVPQLGTRGLTGRQ